MALTTKQRDGLKDSDFAVPETRDLPIHDKVHVGMAWKMVDKTKGLSTDQRAKARRRILRKAHELGMDTSDWHLQAMAFMAMALSFPQSSETHPNKLPFSGVLTRLNVPSDLPLHGTGGKRVIIPSEVAESAVSSLLGMGVDFTPDLDGHNPKVKIGLITEANVVDDAIEISGFFYAADFPEEVQQIQAEQEKLGFSYEAQSLMRSMKADPLVVEACEFTGAAVLYRDKAAYFDTSITANADQENDMTKEQEELLNALAAGVKTLTENMGNFATTQASAIKTAVESAIKEHPSIAAASLLPAVKEHAASIRNCAKALAAANIGCHASSGHVALLNRMADSLEASAAMGQIPHVYNDHSFMYASADDDKATKASIEAAAKLQADAMKPLQDSLAALTTQFADLQTKLAAAAAPATDPKVTRKTFAPDVIASLKRVGLEASSDKPLSVAQIDKACKDANLTSTSSMALKLALKDAGALAN